MTPAHDIKVIYQRALGRIRRLDHVYSVWQSAAGRDRTLVLGGLVVELDNVFVQALRLYVLCALRNLARRGHFSIPGYTNILTDDEFTSLVVGAFDPKKIERARKKRINLSQRDEKTIRNPSEWGQFLSIIGAPLPQDFNNALNLNFTFYEEIGVFRNFYAHRSRYTVQKIAAKFPQRLYGAVKHPDEIISTAAVGLSQAKYWQWSNEGKTFLYVASGQP